MVCIQPVFNTTDPAFWASSSDGTGTGNAYDAPASAPLNPRNRRSEPSDAFGAGSSVWTVPSGVDINREFEDITQYLG